MRIKTIRIDRYGPLAAFSAPAVPVFSLVYGSNEQGKTLIIDAILKMLFKGDLGRRIKDFGNMHRVSGSPHGYVVVEVNGQEFALREKESITSHLQLSPTDFRNIFVVRDSDLGIVQEQEYFAHITEKLAGLRISEIDRIKKILQQQGKLTNPSANSKLSNSASVDHIARRFSAAGRLIPEVEKLKEALLAKDFDRSERLLAETKDRIEATERALDLLRKTELRERYEKSTIHLREVKSIAAALEPLEKFNEADWAKWKELEFNSTRNKSELDVATEKHKEHEERLHHVNQEYTACKAVVDELEHNQKRFDEVIRPKKNRCAELQKAYMRRLTRSAFWKWCTGSAMVMLMISLVGGIISRSYVFYMFSAVLLGAAALSAIRLFNLQRNEGDIDEAFAELKSAAQEFGVEIKSLDELHSNESPHAKKLDDAHRDLREADIRRRIVGKEQFSLAEKIRLYRETLHGITDALSTIQIEAGLRTADEYRSRLTDKLEKQARKTALEKQLQETLGGKIGPNSVKFWQAQLGRRVFELGEEGDAVLFDPDHVNVLEAEVRDLKTKAVGIDDALNIGRKDLRDLELKITHSGVLEDDKVVCRTVGNLDHLRDRLVGFVERIQSEKENVQTALAIFEEIEEEETSKVVELFGSERPVSKYFRDMTDGAYHEVTFDLTQKEVMVTNAAGDRISASKLSGGTFDQLYLSIRLSIAESVLGEQKGFFILDDPFIKADYERLKKQMALLVKLAASGWQILYFSAKKEVLDLLKVDIEEERVGVFLMEEPAPHAPGGVARARELTPRIDN